MQNLDEGLKKFDYSLLSAERERLLQNLLTMRRSRSNITLLNRLMTDDELDYVAASGANYISIKPSHE